MNGRGPWDGNAIKLGNLFDPESTVLRLIRRQRLVIRPGVSCFQGFAIRLPLFFLGDFLRPFLIIEPTKNIHFALIDAVLDQ